MVLHEARKMGDERVKPFFETLRSYGAFRPFLNDSAFHASLCNPASTSRHRSLRL